MKNVFITTLLALYCSIPAMPVTLNVKVPEGTKQCYVVGDFNKWSTATAVEMQSSGENTYTVNIEDVTVAQMEKGYKYLNGRDWTYVEKDADGNEIDNRTKVQELDVVASWNALLNTVTQKCTLTVNGYERNVEIYVPKNYDNETEHYPVIYYTGVHQHYSEAGSDGPGESFFDSRSWDAANIIENAVDNYGAKPAIVVAIYGFVAEQIPYANADFMGSGQSEAFLKGIVDEVMPYVNKNYRTLTGAQNTTLMGADLGGLFSVYATIKHPEIFGKCVSMSPMLWLNMNELTNLAASANFATPARFFLSSGDRELDIITDNVAQISNILSAKENTEVQKIVFAGGIHNDLSWATQLPTAFCFAQGGTAPLPESFTMAPAFVPNEENDIFSTEYSVLTGFDTKELTYDSSLKFMTIDEYFSSANQPTKTKVLTTTIPADFKGTYYWNISRSADGTGELLFEEPRNISFSSKKSTDSWHRIVMYSENDIKNIAASSAFFRICYGEEKQQMSVDSEYKVNYTISMPGTDKTFEIHYGSVNSGSDMGLIAGPFKLSDNCIEADVTYDFATNKVVVTETKFGASVSENAISYFSATPAICCAGTSTTIKTHIDLPEGCTPKLRMGYNYTEPAPVVLCELGNGDYTFTTPTLEEGIYTFTIDYTGSNEQQDVQTIKVKVKPAFEAFTHELMVNPYESIDWDNINRYKANFHAHTSQSFDTELKTNEVVDLYHEKGYDILALTDHDANPYPWTIFNLFNIEAENRDPETLNMLTIPAVELSKNNENSWNESTGSEFNHHNDFFTGRKGQEFATLRESYAYTNSLGGMQIINHPGQYWSLDKVYTSGEKNSPEWHAENFNLFESLVGLEVYNQGNRRPNDRILWDQILDLTMPQRPVWGYSNDDSHNISQYYRNYEFMLMPELTVDALKEAMRNGHSYFSYEYNGSGDAKAPRIENITVNKDEQTITVTTDCEKIYWISGTDISDSANPGSRQSTVLTTGKTFCYKDFQGSYVRALLVNDFGETCTQPFGFDANSSVKNVEGNSRFTVTVIPNPVVDNMTITSTSAIKSINITNMFGQAIISDSFTDTPQKVSIDMTNCEPGIYLVTTVDTANNYNSQKVIVK